MDTAPQDLPSTHLGLAARLKWPLFRLLEQLSDLRGNQAAGHLDVALPAAPTPALWVFASTIGELNAVEPFLRQLQARLSHLRLVLITDHPHYHDSYQSRYAQATVCTTRGHGDDAHTLARHYPPALLVVVEIPCLPSDAPCRFSYAFVHEAKRRGAAAVLVNGWLYHYQPACRLDAIERRLFQCDYLRAFDRLCVQTDEVRQHLMVAGAPAERISVVGNIKFDAMQRQHWTPAQARSPRLVADLVGHHRPIIVAGCVTSLPEQHMVLQAFADVRAVHADALLVLAPRHPEVAERMQALRELLAGHALHACWRSSIDDTPLADEVDCLVLDTLGELRDFYAGATVAHVGVDHNVLEPLGFDKPVTVIPGWEATYPSYPVYRMLSDQNALLEAPDAQSLARHWKHAIATRDTAATEPTAAQAALQRSRGAVDRHFLALGRCLETVA